MMNKNKKALASTTLIIVAVIGILIAVATPQGRGIISGLTGSPTLCSDDPYNWRCVCYAGTQKQPAVSGMPGMNKFACVPKIVPVSYTFPLSPDDAEFQGKALNFARDTLSAYCPGCDTIDCSGSAWLDAVSTMYDPSTGETSGYVECKEQTFEQGGYYWWRVAFNLEDGTFHPVVSTYCTSKDKTKCKIAGI